ncbi:right-handed parallel beta-helix repeat-containing protein [Acidisphaera sp. S103]|uniref:right-handed parallel beta-helix repeat-containing protein n=1 Tax=Acidisphaera sp. S103 TaxID=1747223 RepID=UPI00131B7B01|nr:right-handed parallel beta-helix repeat-containing protein [Acidisphaera sp. S103]
MTIIDSTSGADYATLSAAITGSSANDVLLVPAGTYVENFPDITHSLTIDSVGGLAVLSNPQPDPPNGRAILNVPGDDNVNLTISGLDITGANNDPSALNPTGPSNGAGILFETGNDSLTVLNSWIHGNEDGILTGGADAASTNGMYVTIANSEIDNNGAPSTSDRYGFDHNIYIGAVTQLTVSNSYFHDALGGHEIKSRAFTNIITNNRIQDGPTAQTSYSIDLADGGIDTVTGNVIEKGASAVNDYMVHFGGEGTYPDSSLYVGDNIFINDYGPAAVAVFNQTLDPNNDSIPATIADNTLYAIPPSNLFYDQNGPPFDIVSNNVFLPGPGPTLDTSPGYGVPEPSGVTVLLLASLSMAMVRTLSIAVWWRRGMRLFRIRSCAAG